MLAPAADFLSPRRNSLVAPSARVDKSLNSAQRAVLRGDRAVLAAVSTPNGWPGLGGAKTTTKIAPKAGAILSPGKVAISDHRRRQSAAIAAKATWAETDSDDELPPLEQRGWWVKAKPAAPTPATLPPGDLRHRIEELKRAKAAAAPPPPPPSTATSTLSKSMRRDLGFASPPPVAGAPSRGGAASPFWAAVFEARESLSDSSSRSETSPVMETPVRAPSSASLASLATAAAPDAAAAADAWQNFGVGAAAAAAATPEYGAAESEADPQEAAKAAAVEADVCAWRAKVQRTVADGGAAQAAADRAAAVAALSAALAAVEATKDPWAEAREPATAEYAVIKRTWNVAKGFSYGRTFRLAEGGAIETRDADGRLTNRYEAHRVLGVEALSSRPTDFVLRLAAAAGAFCAGEERITFSAETPWVRDDLLAAATARAVYFADWKSRLPDPVEI